MSQKSISRSLMNMKVGNWYIYPNILKETIDTD